LNKDSTDDPHAKMKKLWHKLNKVKSIIKIDSQYPLPAGQQDKKEVVALVNINRY
jgi:hypothetical protein